MKQKVFSPGKKEVILGLILVVALGLAASVFVYNGLDKLDKNNLKTAFTGDFTDRMNVIRKSLESIPFSFKLIGNYYYQSRPFDRRAFTNFIDPFLPEVSGMREIIWAPSVRAGQKSAMPAPASKEGLPWFKIRPRETPPSSDGRAETGVRAPVLYAASLENIPNLSGADLFSDPALRTELTLAGRSGDCVLSPGTGLRGGESNASGFLFIHPVYASPSDSADPRLRMENLSGFFIAQFTWEGVIEKSIAELQPAGIDISVFDLSAAADDILIYHHTSRIVRQGLGSPSSAGNPPLPRLSKSTLLSIGHRHLKFVMTPRRSYVAKRRTPLPLLGLIIGIISSLTLAFILYKQGTENIRIRELVGLRTEELKQSEERLKLALKGGALGLWDWEIRTGYVYFNERWAEILGYAQSELRPHIDTWRGLLHPDEVESIDRKLEDHLSGRTPLLRIEYRMRSKSGRWVWLLATGQVWEWDAEKRPTRATGVHLDISASKEYEERLELISITDPLTNIHNRRYFFDQLPSRFEQARRDGSLLSVAIVDIDHFKVVNDTYGHQAGDFLLKEFAAIFRGMVRPYDLLARYGGEEFILLTANSDRSRTQAAIQRVLDVVRGKAFLFNGTEIRFTFSGGICDTGEFAEPERTPERLISTADTRLYAAKEAGRNRISAG